MDKTPKSAALRLSQQHQNQISSPLLLGRLLLLGTDSFFEVGPQVHASSAIRQNRYSQHHMREFIRRVASER